MATTNLKKQEKIVKDYEKKSDEIITNMLQILSRAQRKVEDKAYRDALSKLQKTI